MPQKEIIQAIHHLSKNVQACTVDTHCTNGDSCIARPILPYLFQLHYAVHGGWSSWFEVNSCSVSCDGGTKVLVRECNNPVPARGGNYCEGKPFKVENCNDCPGEPRDWDIVTVIYAISIPMTQMHAVCIILIKICTIV